VKKILPLILVVVTVAVVAAGSLFDGERDGAVAAKTLYTSTLVGASAADDESAGAAGYVVYLDPTTGNFTDSPQGAAPLVFDAELQNALSTSSEGLEEVPSPFPGGGIFVDLQGRFQNTMIATIDSDGSVRTSCVSSLPHAHGSDCDHTADTGTSPGGGGQ
jgi:hypothetical protein